MSARGEAARAAHDAWLMATHRQHDAGMVVAYAARQYLQKVDGGESDLTCELSLDALRTLLAKWETALAAQDAAGVRCDAARRVVSGPLATDSEGGYLREWGAA